MDTTELPNAHQAEIDELRRAISRQYYASNASRIKFNMLKYTRNKKHVDCVCGGRYKNMISYKKQHERTQRH